MAHYQQHGQQQAPRVDEYGNPIPSGHGIDMGTGIRGRDAAGGYGRQAGYGPTGTGVHDDGGYGGSGQPAFGVTGTGTHDAAGGVGGYGHTGTGPHVPAHHGGGYGGAEPTGITAGTRTHETRGNLGTGGGHTGMLGGGTTTGLGGTHGAQHKTAGGILRRSGSSSSSSSSEDDGMGGRRKKGMKEKIKEKLPGGGHKDTQHHQSAATGGYGPDSAYATGTGGGTAYADGGTHEKKGMMDKIKEKLPGGHKQDEYSQQHTTTTTATGGGYAPGRTGTTGTYGATEGTHEKKGIMDKIKEKLPGQH